MIRIAEIKQLIFTGDDGRISVQFKDPASTDVENGVLILPTGDNVCGMVQMSAVGIGCLQLGVVDCGSEWLSTVEER